MYIKRNIIIVVIMLIVAAVAGVLLGIGIKGNANSGKNEGDTSLNIGDVSIVEQEDNTPPTPTDEEQIPEYEEQVPEYEEDSEDEENFEDEKIDYGIAKDVSKFDLDFLKFENEKENKIYSPLSIKYALKMIEEGATGESEKQISNVLAGDELTTYTSGNHISLANALFAKNSFKNKLSTDYINTLKNIYGAEVIFDSFYTPDVINSWVSNKTFNLINKVFDNINADTNLLLLNVLGIDMEWKNKFGSNWKPEENIYTEYCYMHEDFGWSNLWKLPVNKYNFDNNKKFVSGMEIIASINKYDIVKALGEENIRKTVEEAYRKYYAEDGLLDEDIEKNFKTYIEEYIESLNSNYGGIGYSTDFSLYTDDEVKVFAKDLKRYNGTTLQYIGIQPKESDLDTYISNISNTKINNIIKNLKDIKLENFKNGVITKIIGYIPKFDFEYNLDLKEDLKKLGINNIFEESKANLTKICDDEDIYITDILHKAKIEFSQYGIKAGATTFIGGGEGSEDSFDYIYDVPVEVIDLTFYKPYMFLIRDKNTGEVWFTGTVYDPLLWENEPLKNY